MATKNAQLRGILPGVLGALLFLLFFVFIDAGLVVSLACALGGVVAGIFLGRQGRDLELGLEGQAAEDFKASIRQAESGLAELRSQARSIPDKIIAAKVEAIAGIVDRAIAQIKQDPKLLKNARQFLGYYLEATTKIVARYSELTAQGLRDAELQASLRRVEGMLDTIREAFEKQFAKLLSNDLLDLDTELSLLEQTIKMEGLGADSEPPPKR
ncbi:MAG TPA: 5-bromo-4-chloroindolyl phosphate hydrolysis family protein [Rectinemataceae bacterium]|nr:5-bromo-4-chloroindolyl phosphate hydrolysis family protein [Rectinemataceae bacterium]